MKGVVSSLLLALLFVGCGSKKYYEPKEITGSLSPSFSDSIEENIIDTRRMGATLEEGLVLSKQGVLKTKIPEAYRVINIQEGIAYAADNTGKLFFQKEGANTKTELSFEKKVVAVSKQNSLLALVLANNKVVLFDEQEKKVVFKSSFEESIAVDSRIASPQFLNDLVLFPTLDGKIVIVNHEKKRIIRTIIVSSQKNFNNIIYFNMQDDVLVAATATKLYVFGNIEHKKSFDIRDVARDGKDIYLLTKQGEVIVLNETLKELKKKKFAFAHFLGLIIRKESIFIAEREGYIIAIDKDFKAQRVYEVDFDDEAFIFEGSDRFYFEDTFIKVK